MMIKDIKVINVEVNIEEVAEFSMETMRFTKDWDTSKMVCLQVNAIVKPNVIDHQTLRVYTHT
jgi:hypothetical protein